MLGETHRRIAREIAKELNLGKREAGLLEVGSINPDSWANFPHHHGKEREIVKNILEARKLFLRDDDECFHKLGIALHYIQDKWTLRPRMRDKHTKWEMAINSAEILNDSELIDEIKEVLLPTKAEQAYLAFLDKIKKYRDKRERDDLLERPTTWSSPVLDLNFAYRICLELARLVFSRKYEDVEEGWEKEITTLIPATQRSQFKETIASWRKLKRGGKVMLYCHFCGYTFQVEIAPIFQEAPSFPDICPKCRKGIPFPKRRDDDET